VTEGAEPYPDPGERKQNMAGNLHGQPAGEKGVGGAGAASHKALSASCEKTASVERPKKVGGNAFV